MKVLFTLGSIIFPIGMLLLQQKVFKLRIMYHFIAMVALLILGNIVASAIYDVIKNETVFMTNIHGLLINPFFLLTGAYLGVYILYLIVLKMLEERNEKST